MPDDGISHFRLWRNKQKSSGEHVGRHLIRFSHKFKSWKGCAQAIADLDQLDQAILAKAFRGELVPQDPNDEPASVLLERIREQKAQQAAAAKRKQKTSTAQRGNKIKKGYRQSQHRSK